MRYYVGISLLPGDPNTLLIGGVEIKPFDSLAEARIFSVGLTRDEDNHITGFAGPPAVYAAVPNIATGFDFSSEGSLVFTQWPQNAAAYIRPGDLPGATIDDVATIDLVQFGFTEAGVTLGALAFVPEGLAGAGQLKFVQETAEFYTAPYSLDQTGVLDIEALDYEFTLSQPGLADVNLPYPEEFIWLPEGSPGFSEPSMLMT